MTTGEIEETLASVAKLRAPRFGHKPRIDAKISRLEDHMLACAYARGDLEECWKSLTDAMAILEEVFITVEVSGRLAEDRERERRMADPDSWGGLRDARRLRTQVERQIHRLSKDEAAVSRAYTFITGQA